MQIYSLALEKGGVGKTCVTVNLAAAFSRLNLRVLVIDLDAQAHATHWLGVQADRVRPDDSFLGIFNNRSLRDCVIPTNTGVDVLPAHPTLASLPVQLATAPNSGLFVLQDVLRQLHEPTPIYDVVICDLAPARGPVLATALAASTRCIAPVQPEELVMRALQALTDSVRQAQRVNQHLRGLSIVRNRYAVRSAGDHVYDQVLRDSYGQHLLNTIIPVRAGLRDSAGLQQNIFRYSGPDANEIRNLFLDLVEELIGLDGAM